MRLRADRTADLPQPQVAHAFKDKSDGLWHNRGISLKACVREVYSKKHNPNVFDDLLRPLWEELLLRGLCTWELLAQVQAVEVVSYQNRTTGTDQTAGLLVVTAP